MTDDLDRLELANRNMPALSAPMELSVGTLKAMIVELREKRDRLAVLDSPGTPTAILMWMFEEAERLGHPRASSAHALGYLLELIDRQRVALRRIEGWSHPRTRMRATKKLIYDEATRALTVKLT